MASHDLSNTKPAILGATPGAIPGIEGDPHERFSFDPAFSELFFKNWGGPRAPERTQCNCSEDFSSLVTIFFASNSRFMRLLQAPLKSCLGSPFFASLSTHGLHFTVYALSNFASYFFGDFSSRGFSASFSWPLFSMSGKCFVASSWSLRSFFAAARFGQETSTYTNILRRATPV